MTFKPKTKLDTNSLRMLESLPIHIRLLHLRRDFPHVLNQLAASWHQPRLFERQMQSLLTDERGNRQGFSYPVMMELVDLQGYYFTEVQRRRPRAPTRSTKP